MLTSSRDIIRRLKNDGWEQVDGKASHRQFKNPERTGKITVPHPKKDLPIGTVLSIYKQAGWDRD